MADTSASATTLESSGGDLAGAKLRGGGDIGEWAVQGGCWGSEGARLVGRGTIPNPTYCRPGFPARQGGKCYRPFWPDSANLGDAAWLRLFGGHRSCFQHRSARCLRSTS